MKKMIICAAAVIVAGMVQASQVTWAFSGIQTVAGGSSIAANASGFAFTGTLAQRNAVLALFGAGTWKTDFDAYKAGLTQSQTAGAGSIAANSNVALGYMGVTTASGAFFSSGATGGYLGAAVADSFGASTQQSLFVVVFDNANYALAGNVTVSTINTQTLSGTGAKNYATTWANWGGAGVAGTYTALVPEPTSMALFGLGIAVLGLRRKFRA